MRVSEIMSVPVYTIGAEESATAAWEMMRFRRTRHLVVAGEDGRVVGVVSASDLGGRHGELIRARRRVSDLMTGKVVATHPKTTIHKTTNLMHGHKMNYLPIFDDQDHLTGIVTVVDLLELIGRGIERPMNAAPRAVMKNRGVVPRQAMVGNRTKRATH